MADGSRGDRTDPKQINDSTFSEPKLGHGDTKKCSDETFSSGRLKLSFYTELDASESCENSDTGTRGVAGDRCEAAVAVNKLSVNLVRDAADERKRRCIERYDSSESSDSGVAVLSPTESGGCSGSDITEPRSPRSPASSCSNAEDSAGERMPPWASDPAPPGQRRIAVQPAPTRRPPPPAHRRITEFFNHKMKPQNGVKRDANGYINEDTKRKCLPKNGVTNELEKYICYLSQTLSPKVLLDVGKQAEAVARKPINTKINAITDNAKVIDLNKSTSLTNGNEAMDCRPKDNKDKLNTSMNGFVEVRHATETSKEKFSNGLIKGMQKHLLDSKMSIDPSANGFVHSSKLANGVAGKVPIPASADACGMRAPAASLCQSPKKTVTMKPDTTRVNGVVSSTTKLGNPMNGVTCGSNNLSLNSITNKSIIQNLKQKETPKKVAQPTKRTNRKSSACIANSKNLTWSKANNLKQVQLLQKQNCMNSVTTSTSIKTNPGEINTTPKINIPNGVRQISMAVNGNLGNLNLPASNYPNCHQINIPQPCNGTVSSNNLASFVAVPHNVMLTTLRIPQNGLPAQTLSQQNNMSAFNRQNMNVSSPTKLNGQLVFPFVQNINGTVVQIPNIMAKMPNFVLPQNSQLAAQRQDHLQNQQAAQFLINGTLLKLANTMPSPYTNKTGPVTSQPLPTMNKNVTGMQSVEMSVQPKATNYTVNLSHPVLVPQPGYIVTSVPNLNVKETWSYTSTNTVSSSQATCSNPLIQHHPSLLTNFATHTLHSSSIPIAPVKPPDNPIQGTDPPSSTVKEPENCELLSQKCDIPWLSKTVNNNIVPLDSNKMCSRPFAELSNLSKKFEESSFLEKKIDDKEKEIYKKDTENVEMMKVDDISREETMFTQITVLKDVLSEVQSTVIEANFSSATTESSESGIGTDKSIDSPSDSQTSKECDEDSSLSLSVSVCSVDVPSCQKSPILKQPKTLRFPPRQPTKADSDRRKSSSDTTATVTICLWEDCKKELESDNDLLEHLQTAHVDTQQGKKNFVCLWERCKVRGKPSCSRLWLERHASSHGGNKPFKCIVDSCGRRFSTQILLERHVNNHLDEASPNTSGGKKATDSAPKLIRRNGKKLRYRRQPWSARMFDFFDSGAMEGLAWRLARSTRWRLGGACPLREARDAPAGHALTLHAALAATRYNAADGRREALLTYYPPNVVEDEWVAEADVKRVKRVEISRLPAATKVLLYDQFCASYRKAGSPPPAPAPAPAAARLQPPRTPASSRLLNNLLAKQKTTEPKDNCSATNLPMVYREEEKTPQVSGARKRKLGRRHGGDCFWPCGR